MNEVLWGNAVIRLYGMLFPALWRGADSNVRRLPWRGGIEDELVTLDVGSQRILYLWSARRKVAIGYATHIVRLPIKWRLADIRLRRGLRRRGGGEVWVY